MKRHRFRFSLRTLLLWMFLAAIAMGVLVIDWRRFLFKVMPWRPGQIASRQSYYSGPNELHILVRCSGNVRATLVGPEIPNASWSFTAPSLRILPAPPLA
jgi:hypothetical protein